MDQAPARAKGNRQSMCPSSIASASGADNGLLADDLAHGDPVGPGPIAVIRRGRRISEAGSQSPRSSNRGLMPLRSRRQPSCRPPFEGRIAPTFPHDVPLTSESVPLTVPLEFEAALEDFTLGTIQQFANGRWNERLERFYHGDRRRIQPSWRERFRLIVNAQAAPQNHDTVPLFYS